jgi:hypothetical protein
MALKKISVGKIAPTIPSAPLPPIIDATNALKTTFGSVLKGIPAMGSVPTPANRPKTVVKRRAGNLLSPTNPPVLKGDARLTSQVRATGHPDIVTFPSHPIVPIVNPAK